MKNEFQLFDKENVLFDFLFASIDEIITSNKKIRNRTLKIFSCYYGAEKFYQRGKETTILNEVREACKKRGIFLELILSKNIYNQHADVLRGSKYFRVYPNSSDAFFHGKAAGYFHGSLRINNDLEGIKEVKITTGEGILLVTSANFSNAYFGNNIETGVLVKNKKALETYLLEFEKSKGTRDKITGAKSYNSYYDIFSNGFMLFKDDNSTLNNISTIYLSLKKKLNSNSDIARIGGVITEGNLAISLAKTGYLNIDEFERNFPKPKHVFSKYSIETPFGLWINHEIYFEIIKLYTPLFEIYKNQIRDCLKDEVVKKITKSIEANITKSDEIMKLLECDESGVHDKITDWNKQLLDNVADDVTMTQMFFGFEAIEFPLDPNYTSTIDKFLLYTKRINYKKPEPKSPTQNVKNVLRPFLESGSNDFNNLDLDFFIIKERIKQEFVEKNNRIEYLRYNGDLDADN